MLIGVIAFAYLGQVALTEAVSVTEAILTAFLVIATIVYTIASIRMQWTNRELVTEARRDREYESVKRLIVFGIDPLLDEIKSQSDDVISLSITIPSTKDRTFLDNIIDYIFNEDINPRSVTYRELPEWNGPESDDLYTDIEDFCQRYHNEAHIDRRFGYKLSRYHDNWKDYRRDRITWVRNFSIDIPFILEREVGNEWMREMVDDEIARDLARFLVIGDPLNFDESKEILSGYRSALENQSDDYTLTHKAREIIENRREIRWSLENLRSHCKREYGIFEGDLNALREDNF